MNDLLMYAHKAKILSCFLNLENILHIFLTLEHTASYFVFKNKTTDGLVDRQNAIKLKDQIYILYTSYE